MVVVVVVALVRRHLLDTGGDASHRLDARLRGRPASCPSPYALAVPSCPHAPPFLSPGAYVALPRPPPGSPPGPKPLVQAHPLPPCRGS